MIPVDFVGRFRNRKAIDHVFEFDMTFDFRHDRAGVGIPLGHTLAALNIVAIIDEDARTVGDAVCCAFLARRIDDDDGHVAAHDDQMAIRVAHHIAVADLHRAFIAGFEERLIDHLRRTTKVERTHRQLRAWLTDRLSSDNADSFTLVDRGTTGQIAAVALGADAAAGLTGESRTDADRLNTSLFDGIDIELVDDVATIDKHVTRNRMQDVFKCGTAKNTLADATRRPGRHRRSAAW